MTRRRVLTAIAVAGGLALLAWQVNHTGLENITQGLMLVGWWGAGGILVLSLLRFAARSTAWSALIPAETPPGRALAAIIAGEAVGTLTPLSMFVSEPAKAAYLAAGSALGSVGVTGALAALAAETFIFAVTVALYIVAGTAVLLYVFPIDTTLRLAGVGALAAMTGVLTVAAFMAWRKPSVVSAVLARVPIRSIANLSARVHAFEQTAYGSTGHSTARLGVVVAAAATFHILSFLEMWLTLWLITGESHMAAAFILDTVGRLTNAVFKMIPLQVGVLQVGSELVASAMGLQPGVGVTVSLVRTMRVLAWSIVGLGLMGRHGLNGPKVQGSKGPTVPGS
jgi:hypothetical protein